MKVFAFAIPALLAGGLVGIVRSILQSVPRGHQATKTRNGAPVKIRKPRFCRWKLKNFDVTTIGQPKIYNPGRPVFKIPFVEEVLIRRVNGQNLTLQTKAVLQDFTVYMIDSFLRFVTTDVVKYTYDNEHPRTALRNKAEELLLRKLSECNYTEMHRIHDIADEVKQQLVEFANQLGLEIEDFGVKTYDPSPFSERMIQMSSQAKMSVDALHEAAKKLGFASTREMGAAWGSVVQGTALNSIAHSGNDLSKLGEEFEDAGEAAIENLANGNGKVVPLHP